MTVWRSQLALESSTSTSQDGEEAGAEVGKVCSEVKVFAGAM